MHVYGTLTLAPSGDCMIVAQGMVALLLLFKLYISLVNTRVCTGDCIYTLS